MKSNIQSIFLTELRNAAASGITQAKECEMYRTPTTLAFDAYGILADLYCLNASPLVSFVPTRRDPNEFFFLDRQNLMEWADLSDGEVAALIEMNDGGLGFAEIADAIESGEWV